MTNNLSRGTFFNSIPVYISLDTSKQTKKEPAPGKLLDLEKDVEIEEEYLEYLFHYNKDISHIVSK